MCPSTCTSLARPVTWSWVHDTQVRLDLVVTAGTFLTIHKAERWWEENSIKVDSTIGCVGVEEDMNKGLWE